MITQPTSLTQIPKSFFLFLGVLTFSTACSSPEDSQPLSSQAVIAIDGSSTVYPITNEIAQEYQLISTKQPEIRINVSGTGGGFRRFCLGETDISNASRPVNAEEMAICQENDVEYIELPIAYDALTVVVHPDNDWVNQITTRELATIWEPNAENRVTKWNQVHSQWPDRPLNLYSPGADSGTFDYFTEAIIGEAEASRTDYFDSEDDTLLVRGVREDLNSY